MLQSGELLYYDFRDKVPLPTPSANAQLRIVQWNIERGYELPLILSTLADLNADILILQELDIGCQRTENKDIAMEIAKHLKMYCVFVCEFEEIHSPFRGPREQGGGIHGNAILSKYDIIHPHVVIHKHQPDWENVMGHKKKQPRKGSRSFLAATVCVADHTRVHCYCMHAEVFCGSLMRARQIGDVFTHIRKHRHDNDLIVFGGDLNTMGHGIVRLSPSYCNDITRWTTIGQTEAEWFHHTFVTPKNPSWLQRKLFCTLYGFTEKEYLDCLNPGLVDPWDVYHDVTFNNASYKGFVQGKYDWTFLRGFAIQSKFLFNNDYKSSDHKGMVLDVVPTPHHHLGKIHHQKSNGRPLHRVGVLWCARLVAFLVVLLVPAAVLLYAISIVFV